MQQLDAFEKGQLELDLDVNPELCDETGGLKEEYTFDGVHLKAQYIEIWKDFLKTHAIL